QRDGMAAAKGHVRRVDLEVREEDVALARRDVAELEGDAAVVAGLADGARLDRVDGHALGPARAEHEVRVFDLLARGDVEARLEDQSATEVRRRIDLQRSLRRDECR